jgi:hypothetical protein
MSEDTTRTDQNKNPRNTLPNQNMFFTPGEYTLPQQLNRDMMMHIKNESIILHNNPTYDASTVPVGNGEFRAGSNNPENVGVLAISTHEIGVNCSSSTDITKNNIYDYGTRMSEALDNFVLNNEEVGLISNTNENNTTATTIERLPEAISAQIRTLNESPGKILVILNGVSYGIMCNHAETVRVPGNNSMVFFRGAELVFCPFIRENNLALVIKKTSLKLAFPSQLKVATTMNTLTMTPFFSFMCKIGIHREDNGIKLINLQAD